MADTALIKMKNKTKNCNEDIQKLAQIKWRAETEYAQNLFIYTKCPNGTGTKIEAYGRLWLLAGILGYSADKVMQDTQKAEKGE